MKHLGFPVTFLGVQIVKTVSGIILHQQDLVLKILARFGMVDCTPVSTPMDSKVTFDPTMGDSPLFTGEYRQAIGFLQYLVTCSRPDIAVAVFHFVHFYK